MEAKDSADRHIDRKFEVYDIDWIINDVSLATCGDNWSIPSPEFTVTGFQVTKWLIVLTQTSNESQSDSVVFILKRCSFDGGPESVCVEWRLTISVSDCDKAITIERICDFGVGTEYGVNLKDLKNYIEMIKPFESDLMTIRCRMIIYDRTSSERSEVYKDKGIFCLSQDLLTMFRIGRSCDLALKIDHNIILAHKAIVCTRIKKFSQLLDGRDSDTCNKVLVFTIDLPHLHYEAMMKIMKYVYSGDSSFVLYEPSLGIYDNVQILDMDYLKQWYYSKKLSFRTSVNTQESKFTWVIGDYLAKYKDFLVSPAFYDNCSTTWRLNFSIAEENHFNYFSLFAKNVGQAELGDLCIEFAITNEYGGTVFARWLRRAAGDPEPLGFEKFIRQSTVRNFLTKDTLRITMKLKVSSCAIRSYLKKQDIELLTGSHKIDSFQILSRDMQNMSDFADFSDLLLYFNGGYYGVHKCIVAARFYNFLSRLRNEKNASNCIRIGDFERDILTMLLNYIYSGTIPKDAGRQALTELREAAKACHLPMLACMCLEGIKEMDAEN